jgi:membrane protease YdiL (CAAX protease family)
MTEVIPLVLFLGLWGLLWLPLAFVVAGLLQIPVAYPIAQDHKIPLLLPLYGVAPLAVCGYSRVFTSHRWLDYGLGWGSEFWLSVTSGFAIAVVGVLLLVLAEWGLGWRQVSPKAAVTPETSAAAETTEGSSLGQRLGLVAGILALTGFIGGIEELVFRGVLVQGLYPVLSIGGLAVATSLIFAVSHLLWDGPAGVPSLPGLTLMGAVLLLARGLDGGSLGLPWGLHSGWIFAIALVDTLALAPKANPPQTWMAGQPDQPLTSLLALMLLGCTGLALWGYHQLF